MDGSLLLHTNHEITLSKGSWWSLMCKCSCDSRTPATALSDGSGAMVFCTHNFWTNLGDAKEVIDSFVWRRAFGWQ